MDRRRTPGLSSLSTNRLQTHHYTNHGASLRTRNAQSLETQLSVFQSLVHNFALTHSKDIRANPAFRAEFARMCTALNIDFLASSYHKEGSGSGSSSSLNGKGPSSGESIWASLLGGSVHDFYFNLGVTIVEVCRATRAENGGLISLSDLKTHVKRGRAIGSAMDVSDADIEQAVRALEPLDGISVMHTRRPRIKRDVDLANGPGKLCAALAITGASSGKTLQRKPVVIREGEPVSDDQVEITTRIGITRSADWPLRWIVRGNRFVSKGKLSG